MIIISGLLIRLLAASSEPFLHDWDERFHALVARNMMDDPFTPMLKASTLLSFDDLNAWCCNHIWLHKPPLFLWQMALSMKIFGVSLLAMRLPSILMGTVMIWLLFRTTVRLTGNTNTALLAATLLSFSHFHLILTAGIKGMDHNDIAFGFYVLASFWAWLEYTLSGGKWNWAILTGLLAGCAVLNKWLTGLVVFLAWGIYLMYHLQQLNRREIFQFIVALLACGAVFLPWQVYIFHRFPAEAAYESAQLTKHVFEVVEGHSGPFWFYLKKFPAYFGKILWIGVFTGLTLTFLKKEKKKPQTIALILTILLVFCFFSFIAKTKVDAYFFVVAPLCMMFIAVSLNGVYNVLPKKYILASLYLAAALLSLNLPEIYRYYSPENLERNKKIYNASTYKNIKKYIPDHVKVVTGVNSFEDVELMFYHSDIIANHWWIAPADLERLAAMKVHVAVFKSHAGFAPPDFLLNYPYLYVIDQELK
jgi:4-amino-4-deoxy-L-arabinose transferase-like glycosyltransferase